MAERLRASGGSSQSDRNKDSNPFTHSSHGNPAFTPQKVSKGSNIVSKRHEEWLIPSVHNFFANKLDALKMPWFFLYFKSTVRSKDTTTTETARKTVDAVHEILSTRLG